MPPLETGFTSKLQNLGDHSVINATLVYSSINLKLRPSEGKVGVYEFKVRLSYPVRHAQYKTDLGRLIRQ